MYYELLEPASPTDKPPVMMVTGGTQSGASYLVTPDGRPGWAHAFVARGHTVLLCDWPGVGRSGDIPAAEVGGETVVRGLARVMRAVDRPLVLLTHSMSGAFGWKLLEREAERILGLVGVAPAPPGNMGIELGRLVGDEGGRKVVAMPAGTTAIELDGVMRMSLEFARAKKVGSGTRFPAGAAFEAHYESLQGVGGRLTWERTNIGGAQLRVEDTTRLRGKRVAVLTGTNDTDHPKALDAEVVAWLNAQGALADYLYLGDLGIHGNGHMPMHETNSDEVAHRIMDWIDALQ